MDKRENLIDVLKVLFQWRKHIIYWCLGIGIGTALISLLLPNYYESTTTFYAASVDQVKPAQIFGTSTRDTDFYGTDQDNDRLMTIAESNELANFIIDKFNLYEHYDIDTSNVKAPFKVKERFFKYYTVIKTKRDAIELSMEDTDKRKAANIVNAAREKIDELYIKIIHNQLNILEQSMIQNINEKESLLENINQQLQTIKKEHGIVNTETQSEVFAKQIVETEAKKIRETARLKSLQATNNIHQDTIEILKANIMGYTNELQILKDRLDLFQKGLSSVLLLEREQKELSTRLSEQKVQLNQLKTISATPISGINLIEAGTVPVVKSRPKRSLIVLSAMLITFIFLIVGILLFDNYKNVDWNTIIKES